MFCTNCGAQLPEEPGSCAICGEPPSGRCGSRAGRLARNIADRRLRAAFLQVLDTIEERHRQYFLGKCLHVSDKDAHSPTTEWRRKHVHAYAAHDTGRVQIDGVSCFSPSDGRVIRLKPTLADDFPEDVVTAIVAHEVAHVVLQHDCAAYRAADRETRQVMKQVHEWDADLLAWKWGFSEQIQAAWEAMPRRAVPPWYDQVTVEDENV
jgi:hypothetical protein